MREIERAKQRFDVPPGAPVKSCYEAGREGFWLHRWLVSVGIDNRVVDASSLEVSRRSRRAKTDRLDATRLLWLLVRFWEGERRVWSVVQLDALRLWDGTALPTGLRARLDQERERLELLNRQIQALEAERREQIRAGGDAALQKVRRLLTLQGIGSNRAWLDVMERVGAKCRLSPPGARCEPTVG